MFKGVFTINWQVSDFHHKSERKMITFPRDRGSFNLGVFGANCFRLPHQIGNKGVQVHLGLMEKSPIPKVWRSLRGTMAPIVKGWDEVPYRWEGVGHGQREESKFFHLYTTPAQWLWGIYNSKKWTPLQQSCMGVSSFRVICAPSHGPLVLLWIEGPYSL